MSQTPVIKLENFLIFNPGLSKYEGEEEKKILYYFPIDVPRETQMKTAGLCEALIKFSASFHPDKPCEIFCTEKRKQFLLEVEPGFWFVMTLKAEDIPNKKNMEPSDYVKENIYKAVLRNTYRMYYLFTGSISNLLLEENEQTLNNAKLTLRKFFNKYLNRLNVNNVHFLNIFEGIQYLPLSKEPFLHVHSFINYVESTFPAVRHSVFLYNDHLVWSGIDPLDMQILYQYLVKTLLPLHPDIELQGGSLPGASPGSSVAYGSFVTGPSHLKDKIISHTEAPVVHLHCNGETIGYHLVVYRALSATLCMFLQSGSDLSLKMCRSLEQVLGPRLTTLVSEISEYGQTPSISKSTAKFIYFNKLNLAVKSSGVESGKTSLPSDVMDLLAAINNDKSMCCDNGEVLIYTNNDSWVNAKFSNGREFYVASHKKSSLEDISAEVKKICNVQLKGIFFLS